MFTTLFLLLDGAQTLLIAILNAYQRQAIAKSAVNKANRAAAGAAGERQAIAKSAVNKAAGPDLLTPKQWLEACKDEAKGLRNTIIRFGETGKISEFPIRGITAYTVLTGATPVVKKVEYQRKDGTTGITKEKVWEGGQLEERPFKALSTAMRQAVYKEVKDNIKALAAKKKKGGGGAGRLRYVSEVREIDLGSFVRYYDNGKSNGGFNISIAENKVKLPYAGWVRVRGLKQIAEDVFPGIPLEEMGKDFIKTHRDTFANAKVLFRPDGYYIAITTETNKEDMPESKNRVHSPIGIDMGCKTAITCSTGEKHEAVFTESPRVKELLRKLAKSDRLQGKGTKIGWKRTKTGWRTKRELRRAYQKITNKKNDRGNKEAANILRYDQVYLQDENLKGWHKGGHGKAVQHSILGRVKAKLITKAKASPQKVFVLKQNVPTTRICDCGYVWEAGLKQSVRVMPECPKCGKKSEDRDIHAARMMVIQGQNPQNLKAL
ncbi:MAG: transposase [Treponematales bacterium]